MPVQAVGNPPPEANQIRALLEEQLPDILASFNHVLREQYGLSGVRVGGFTVVPESETSAVTCDQETCSIN